MKKIETIWNYLLLLVIEKNVFKYTQKELASYFGYSLSTINLAVKQLAQIGALDIKGRFFVINDVKKILYYWASHRNLQKSILYETYVDVNIQELEGLVPSETIFAGYTSAKHILKESPSDYSKVYIYINEEDLNKVESRFPKINKTPNLIVLRSYPKQREYGNFTNIAQTFVDIWNMNDWYAKDFLIELERKIDGILP